MSEWSERMDSPEWVARCRHCGYRRRDHFADNVCPDKSSPRDHSAWPETRYEAQDDAALSPTPPIDPVCQHRWHESPAHGQPCIHCGASFPGPECDG